MSRRAAIVTALLAVAAVVGVGGRVHAHTELDFTVPADGATVGEPVPEITIAFTEPVTLVGNGFEVLDPSGTVIEPFAVTDDDKVFRLQLDPPLAGGTVGVRYQVTAEDGHVLEGSFVFDVAAPAPTTPAPTTPPSTTLAATSVAPASTEPLATTTPATSAVVTGAPVTSAAVALATPDDDGDDSSRNTVIGVAAVIAVAALAFLVVRSRRHP